MSQDAQLFSLFPERFIQKVLHNADRQHVDVDKLTAHDVDQLSRLIVDALQVVDKDQGQKRGPYQARPGPRDVGGQLTDEEEEEEERALTLDPGEDLPVPPADLQGQFA